jgi:hypothetical protein
MQIQGHFRICGVPEQMQMTAHLQPVSLSFRIDLDVLVITHQS